MKLMEERIKDVCVCVHESELYSHNQLVLENNI